MGTMAIRLKLVSGSFIHLWRSNYKRKSVCKGKRDVEEIWGVYLSASLTLDKQEGMSRVGLY